ncbi:hypothetical protein [Anabaenopsis sp. FSS-46]|uniref:hypothetical protein n=1 Tax=Anabaenopsis sp. FSS-46 TaxID=2971766 RepID=UPI0032AF2AB8
MDKKPPVMMLRMAKHPGYSLLILMLIALLLAGAQATIDPLPAGVTLLRIVFLPLPGLAFPEVMIHLQLLRLYQVAEVPVSSQLPLLPLPQQVSDQFELCGKAG